MKRGCIYAKHTAVTGIDRVNSTENTDQEVGFLVGERARVLLELLLALAQLLGHVLLLRQLVLLNIDIAIALVGMGWDQRESKPYTKHRR